VPHSTQADEAGAASIAFRCPRARCQRRRRRSSAWSAQGWCFPSAWDGPLSEVAISKLVRDLKIGGVPHGFRSSFRDRAPQCSDAPREVCELALAQVNTNIIEAALPAHRPPSGDGRSWSSGPPSWRS